MTTDTTVDTVAIVTGASHGLGHALAMGLLCPGTLLITVARHHAAGLDERAAQSGARVQQIQADMSDPATAQATALRIAADMPRNARRYLLVNNAGTVEPVGLACNLGSAAAITAAFTLNVSSIMLLVAAFLQATQGLRVPRRILNISSGAGRRPTAGWGVYCATKAALDRYSEVLQAEHHDVRVVSLAPGVIDTPMQEKIRGAQEKDFPDVERFKQLHQKGALAPAVATANKILHYLERDDFGSTVLDDIRNYP
jgi:sepiapterin reductase